MTVLWTWSFNDLPPTPPTLGLAGRFPAVCFVKEAFNFVSKYYALYLTSPIESNGITNEYVLEKYFRLLCNKE
jgi:hypothetical protein